MLWWLLTFALVLAAAVVGFVAGVLFFAFSPMSDLMHPQLDLDHDGPH